MLANTTFYTTKSLENLENDLCYYIEDFQIKFESFKEAILNYEARMQPQQFEGLKMECEKCNEEVSEFESESVDSEDETEETNQKLAGELIKNTELQQDVDDLNATIDLYVREAQKREKLEEEWIEKVTGRLKEKVRNLEDEIIRKSGKIHNLENTIVELRGELNNKNFEIFSRDKEIGKLRKLLKESERAEQNGWAKMHLPKEE